MNNIMKRTMLMYFLQICISCVCAQDAYRPFVEEGKEWVVGEFSNGTELPTETHMFYFDGDTLIHGKACKWWWRRDVKSDGTITGLRRVAPLYEEGRAVYFFNMKDDSAWDDEESEDSYSTPARMLYNFNITTGGSCKLYLPDKSYVQPQDGHGRVVGEVGTSCMFRADMQVRVGDGEVRCLCYWNEWSEQSDYYSFYLEGIGSTLSPDLSILTGNPKLNLRLMECRVGDEVVYTSDDDPSAAVSAMADRQEGIADIPYRPFVEDGKQWTVISSRGAGPVQPFLRTTYYFEGDTLIAGVKFKKLMQYVEDFSHGTSYTAPVFPVLEYERHVEYVPEGSTEPLMLYDFNATRGNIITLGNGDNPKSIATATYQVWMQTLMSVGGNVYRCQRATDFASNGSLLSIGEYVPDHLWVEGIGSLITPVSNLGQGGIGELRWLAECRVGNEILYHDPNYDILLSGIKDAHQSYDSQIHNHQSPNRHIFDLSGRRLAVPSVHGLYIEDGKVRVK